MPALGAIADIFGRVLEGRAAGFEKLRDALAFVGVFVESDGLLAGAQAAAHFTIDAAGVLGRGLEIFLRSGGAGRDRGVRRRSARRRRGWGKGRSRGRGRAWSSPWCAETGWRWSDAGKRRAQVRDLRPIVGEMALCEFEMENGRLKLRAGGPILDAFDDSAETEGTVAFARREKPAQAAAEKSGAREIGLAFAGPKQKDSGAIGDRVKIERICRQRCPHDPMIAAMSAVRPGTIER